MSEIKKVTVVELVGMYIERQEATAAEVEARLERIRQQREVTGFFLAEAQLMDSSWFGSRVILPYGPGCTHKEVPTTPFSPRGLASDTSVVVAFAEVANG